MLWWYGHFLKVKWMRFLDSFLDSNLYWTISFLRDDYVQIFLYGKFTANNVDASSKSGLNNGLIKKI